MARPITAGIDGSAAGFAAATWAAREAELRRTPLHLVAAWPAPEGTAPGTPEAKARRRWASCSLDLARDRLRSRHPRLDLQVRLLDSPPLEALLGAGAQAELLVLGSRGLGGRSALLVGSTGARTAARADFPVTLVRPGPGPGPGERRDGPVLLALDAGHHVPEDVIAHAFEEAALRGQRLRALYAWTPAVPVRAYPVRYGQHSRTPRARRSEQHLTEALLPWRRKFPDVHVEEVCLEDVPAGAVAAACRHAVLAVLGHRLQLGNGARLGAVAHAAVRQAVCPVTLVPHG
ncbi:nucleotide-binding universal stress UspA family protein [Streptomyces sp. SAI-126]|uniref:universal stress protein n=1 Tax=Streptomyces sp. SAI-126 TaxID=3377732 RepID=UPI003C7B3EA0